MGFGRKVYHTVHLFLAHKRKYLLELAYIQFHEAVVGPVLYVFQVGQVACVGEFVHIDYAAFRILVHEKTHDVRAYEARTSRDDDAFSSGHFVLVV